MRAEGSSHEALMKALQAGTPGAEHAFWQGSWPSVLAVCTRVLGPGFSAEEVAVEVLAEFMIRYAQSLTHPRAAWPYLRLMAARRAYREKAQLARPTYEEMDRFISEAGVEAESHATCQLLLPRLQACMEQLTPKAQRAVKMSFYGELTNERIGNLLGCTKQYVGKLLKKSLVALRRCLERTARRHAQSVAGGVAP